MSSNKVIVDPWVVRVTTTDSDLPKYWKGPLVNNGRSVGALKQAKRFESRQVARQAMQDAFNGAANSKVKSRSAIRLSEAKGEVVSPFQTSEQKYHHPTGGTVISSNNTSKRGPKKKEKELAPLAAEREARTSAPDFEEKVEATFLQILDAYAAVKNNKTKEPPTKRLARELVSRGVSLV